MLNIESTAQDPELLKAKDPVTLNIPGGVQDRDYAGSPGHFLFWSVSLLLIFQIKCQCTEVLNTYLSIHIY